MVATLFTFAVLLQEAGAPSFDLRDMLKNMGTLALVVVFILFVLSIYSFGVMIDRFLMYSAARKQSRVFVQQVAGALKDGNLLHEDAGLLASRAVHKEAVNHDAEGIDGQNKEDENNDKRECAHVLEHVAQIEAGCSFLQQNCKGE